MDIQMPGMSGLEATRALREREGDGPRIPVVAMTAHAMAGDRETCLEAGMDGYVSKPIDPEQMARELSRFLEAAPAEPLEPVAPSEPVAPNEPVAAAAPKDTALPVLDPGQLLDIVGDRPDVIRSVLQDFVAESKEQIDALEAAIARDDRPALRDVLHGFRGASSNVGATALEHFLRGLEAQSKPAAVAERMDGLRHELSRLDAEINAR